MREVLCLEDGQGVFADSTGIRGTETADMRMKMAEYVKISLILRPQGSWSSYTNSIISLCINWEGSAGTSPSQPILNAQ